MKKALFLAFFPIIASVSFAQAPSEADSFVFIEKKAPRPDLQEFYSGTSSPLDIQNNRHIYVEGSSITMEMLEYFMANFKKEAIGTGYTIVDRKPQAGYIFKFHVDYNYVVGADGIRRQAPPDENQYVITISLIRNADNFEVLSFDFYFSFLEEMYEHNRNLFYRAASFIPPLTEDDLTIIVKDTDMRWQNKWLYVRASVDYPLTFYILQPTGLIGGIGVYEGDFEEPERVSPLDHKFIALPGFTIGLEIQFLNFMSLEVNYQMFWGDPHDNYFVNIASGAELKFPIKTSRLLIVPYGAANFPLVVSPVFSKFPVLTFGGGVQLGIKGGSGGVFFVDVKCLYSFEDTFMKNPYGELYPMPKDIHYERFLLGLGIGYKYGFGDRKKKE
jgi:hypothetical protein